MLLSNKCVEILTHSFELCPLSEVILYSCLLSGPSALSIVRRLSVSRRVRYGKFHYSDLRDSINQGLLSDHGNRHHRNTMSEEHNNNVIITWVGLYSVRRYRASCSKYIHGYNAPIIQLPHLLLAGQRQGFD